MRTVRLLAAGSCLIAVLGTAACGPKGGGHPDTPEGKAQAVVEKWIAGGDTALWDFDRHAAHAVGDSWTTLNDHGKTYVARGAAELCGATGTVRPPGATGAKGEWTVSIEKDDAIVTLKRAESGTAVWKLAKTEAGWRIYDTNDIGMWSYLSEVTGALYRTAESPQAFRLAAHEIAKRAGSDTKSPIGVKVQPSEEAP